MNAEIDKTLAKLVNSLVAEQKAVSDGLLGKKPVPWAHVDYRVTDTHSFDKIDEIFSRKKLEEKYKQLVDNKNVGGKLTTAMTGQTLVQQADWMMALEREFRWRHKSRIQLIAYEALRRKLMGDGDGPLQASVMEHFKYFVKRQTIAQV